MQENEDLQTQLFVLRRHVKDLSSEARGEDGRGYKRSPYGPSSQQRRPPGAKPFNRGYSTGTACGLCWQWYAGMDVLWVVPTHRFIRRHRNCASLRSGSLED